MEGPTPRHTGVGIFEGKFFFDISFLGGVEPYIPGGAGCLPSTVSFLKTGEQILRLSDQ